MKKTCLLLLFSFLPAQAFAEVRLPNIFGEHMVLQRNAPIPVWGSAAAGESIEVNFNKQTKKTRADSGGKWMVKLAPEKAGGPFRLEVKGKNVVAFNDVLIGDVWLCGGQSNMEFNLYQAQNAEQEISAADYPLVRHFMVSKKTQPTAEGDIHPGYWNKADKYSARYFTAVGYFFAKELYNELKIPIGLINNSWGGTHCETWTSREAFEGDGEFGEMIAAMPKGGIEPLIKAEYEVSVKKVQALQGGLDLAGAVKYAAMSTDDSQWPKMNIPGQWDGQALGDMDGAVWLRKTVALPAGSAGKGAALELAKIDDADDTYVNEVKVGSMTAWDVNRKYEIPPGVLKDGKNLIAVRVLDTVGGGGIYGEPSDMKLTVGGTVVPLAGSWPYRVESVTANITPNRYPTLLFEPGASVPQSFPSADHRLAAALGTGKFPVLFRATGLLRGFRRQQQGQYLGGIARSAGPGPAPAKHRHGRDNGYRRSGGYTPEEQAGCGQTPGGNSPA